MDTKEAKKALIQFRNWMAAAEKVQQVVDATADMERRADEAKRSLAGYETAVTQLKAEREALTAEVEAARQGARDAKLALEHQTNRVKERARSEQEKVEQEIVEAVRYCEERTTQLRGKVKTVEDECVVRERRALAAAAEAETKLQDLRKRLGAV